MLYKDYLILLMPMSIISISLVRMIDGFIWLAYLVQGKHDYFGVHPCCKFNFFFYFPSVITIIITALLNLAIWVNFIGSVSLIRIRRPRLLKPLRLWVIMVFVFLAFLVIFLPVLMILLYSCRFNDYEPLRLYVTCCFGALSLAYAVVGVKLLLKLRETYRSSYRVIRAESIFVVAMLIFLQLLYGAFNLMLYTNEKLLAEAFEKSAV